MTLSQVIGPLSRSLARSGRLASAAAGGVSAVAAMRVLRPVRPDRLARVLAAQRRHGTTIAFAAAAAAALHPDRPAVIDEHGALTFAGLDAQARALAGALHGELGFGADDRLAIMCRNHRGFVQAAIAASRLGADLLPLNTDFAGPQLADVLQREAVTAVVFDEEFEQTFDAAGCDLPRILAWNEREWAQITIDALLARGARGARGEDAPRPRTQGRTILMTSGTTGTPKGARRTLRAWTLAPLALAGLMDMARIKPPPRSGEALVVAPPLFHLYGQLALMVAFGLGSPIVVRRRFDPAAALAQIEDHRAAVLLAVPTMLKRIMDLAPERRRERDCSSLKMIVSGAAPLAPELANAVMDEFGDVLYNGYASTEVGTGALATPADLRAAPGTVGRPAAGVRIEILDDAGARLPPGETGRIFIGSPLLFDGYTDGAGKQVIRGLMSSGDVGHFDEHGRLFIDGRDDDMILSGGENVFPQEIEELLCSHPSVADAAVFGVPDADFGQRLEAYVIRKPDAAVSAEALQRYVRERLARHKVPREITFVTKLPRTSTGKLQRRRLADVHK